MTDLRCSGISKSFGARAVLQEIDLLAPQGTLTAILGVSGSGKTTLLRIIVGFLRADRGSVSVGETLLAGAPNLHRAPEMRGMGYVAQEGALFSHLSVGENVGFGLSRSERRSGRIVEALELVGLNADDARRNPHELSGGQQRRVALARALAPRPQIILLDEPFAGLDPSSRVETRLAVLHALAQARATALLVTHDQAEALSLGHSVAVLRDGHLVQTATPEVLYQTPVDVELARFVGDAVILPGLATDHVADCALGRVRLRNSITGAISVMLRPEQIEIVSPHDESGTQATVTELTYFGAESHIHLRIDGDPPFEVMLRRLGQEHPQIGEAVRIAARGEAVAYPASTTTDGNHPAAPGVMNDHLAR